MDPGIPDVGSHCHKKEGDVMKRTLFALFVVSLLLLTVVPNGSDADTTDEKFRVSTASLYRLTCEATSDYQLEKTAGVFVYNEGEDDSMLAYINSINHMSTPEKGLTTVERGHRYTVYSTNYNVGWPFDVISRTTALSSYTHGIWVSEGTAITMTVKSIISYSGTEEERYYCDVYTDSGDYSRRIYYVDEAVRLSYNEYGSQRIGVPMYGSELYYEFTAEMQYKEFAGSPYLYVGLTVAVVVLIGAMIAICGRKPKLE